MIKLNVGASPIWNKDGWHTLDHKFRENTETSIQGDASNIPLDSGSCLTVFTSHEVFILFFRRLRGTVTSNNNNTTVILIQQELL